MLHVAAMSLPPPAASDVQPLPWDEEARLAALDRYGILDTPTEADFDDIVRLVADTFDAPIAVVNLIADGRQWFKAEIGIGQRELPLDVSICAHAILQSEMMVVPDTRRDERFACNPLVTMNGGLRFYAGALLKTPEGLPIGTVCVIDRAPRPDGITPHQRLTLEVLARQVMSQLELRRAMAGRARRDAALRVSEARYRSLFNSLDAGFCVIEVAFDDRGQAIDYRFIETNAAFSAHSTLTDVVGRWRRTIEPVPEQRWFDVYGRVALTGETMRFEDYSDAVGGIWYEIQAFRVGDADLRQIAILFTDITERRRAEAELRELNETLDRRVSDAIEAREQAQEALRQSQKLEAIGQLTGGVAHDFNNLLTVIRGSVDLLRRPSLSAERRARYIDAIGDTADRAARLTGQLLAFARRQTLSPVAFDSGESLVEVASIVRTLVGSRIELTTRIPPDPCFVRADRSQFDTTIINLAINARDAMNGEGRLEIATAPVNGIPPRRSHAPAAGDYVAITVTDSGSGIAPDALERIFEPFFTTKAVGEGTGLGLSQAIGFAKQSNGDIHVESVVGEGTTFTLYLPRVDAPAAEPAAPGESAAAPRGDGVCVLVVEDNEQVGDFATRALKELGYDSVLAPDAGAALTLLAECGERFDIVFSDVVMPGMSGIELAGEIRRRHPDLPVILTSGYSHVLAREGSAGFDLLHKPYSVEQLSTILRKALCAAPE